MNDLVERLKTRASIRRQISSRKSVQEGKPDRISDLLEEAAKEIETFKLENESIRKEIGKVMEEGHNDWRLKNVYLNQLLELKRAHSI